MSDQTITNASPPWILTGNGYIVLYRFKHSWGTTHGHIPQHMQASYQGGIGALMLVDYHSSDIGPYHELLFIPGLFQSTQRWTYSITRIFVSTMTSVINGQNNWAIPKEHAEFQYVGSQNSEHIVIKKDQSPIFDAEFSSSRWKLPLNTVWSPIKPSIVQYNETDDNLLRTQPIGKGRVARSRLKSLDLDPVYFPDVRNLKPLLSLKVTDFTLTFPHPEEE